MGRYMARTEGALRRLQRVPQAVTMSDADERTTNEAEKLEDEDVAE